MALIVEDGTGLATAESYISVADASARLADLGMTSWVNLTTEEMEQALRRATQYMLQAWRETWQGYRKKVDQALDWPRYGVEVDSWYVDPNSVPATIANACADLALKAAAGDLAPDLTQQVVRKKIGPLETEYNPASPQFVRFRSIDMAVAPYLKASGPMVRLVRA